MWKVKLAAAATVAAVLFGGLWAYGNSRYQDGYAAAEVKAEKQQSAATEILREQQHRASQTYQQAKAEREAAERIHHETLQKLAQSPDYGKPCFDADGLQQLNDTIGKP